MTAPVKKLAVFLTIGVVGVAALLSGLALDAYLHAKDPTLAHREGIFSITNPGHVLLGLGIALVVVGLVGASYTTLPVGMWTRRAFLAGSLALIVLSGDAAGWAATTQLTTASGATGDAAAHNHDVAVPATGVTGAQLQAAVTLIEATTQAVAKYKDQRVAVKAGYKPMEPPNLEIVHFVNSAYLNAADVLNPAHVQSLIYYNGKHGAVLIGAMYMMPKVGIPGPEIGGTLTVWHRHDNLCFTPDGRIIAFAHDAFFDNGGKSGQCPAGSSNRSTPDMLHVWLIANPDGPFGIDMNPDVLAALN